MVVTEYLREFRRPRLWAALYRHAYPRVDRLVCQSRDMRDDLVTHFGFPARKTRLIHNPLDLARIARAAAEPLSHDWPAGALRLVAAGRLVEQKGFDLLIDAVRACPELPLSLVILGEGPQRETLRQQIDARGQQARIQLAGFQPNPHAWFAQADGFVLSSRYEGFSNAVLEALACGTPVIALPCPGGVREALEGVPGCLIAESLDATGLARALCDFAKAARARVPATTTAPYAVEHIVAAYESLFDEVIAA